MLSKAIHVKNVIQETKINPLLIASSTPIKSSSVAKSQSTTGGSSRITDKDIAWLWLNLTKAFGYKFLRNFGEKDNGIWLEALKDLSREDLEYGFKRAIRTTTAEEREKYESWPPNVKEFRMYCERRLKDFGLPETHAAFSEAKNNNYTSSQYWSHPLVKMATQQLKKSDNYVDNADYPVFKKIYDFLCQRFMRGEGLRLTNC